MDRQSGFSMVEVLLAIAISGILLTVIPGAIFTANKTMLINNEYTLAESLARSQMDYVQSQTYDKIHNPPVYDTLSNLPSDYSIITPMAERLDPKGDGIATDDGLQKITVTVVHGTKNVYTLIDYKINPLP